MQSFKDEKSSPPSEKSVFADIPPEEDEERYVLYRGQSCFVILNLYPYNCGHLLVVPYMQTPEFSDLDDSTKLEIMQLADVCMRALKVTLKPQGFNLGVNLGKIAGGSIDTHIHFHIVPRWDGDTNFMPVLGDTKVLSNDMKRIYRELRETIAAIMKKNEQ